MHTMWVTNSVYTYIPYVYFSEMYVLQNSSLCQLHTIQRESFEKENFANFEVLWLFAKVFFPANFGGVASFCGTSEQYTVIILVARTMDYLHLVSLLRFQIDSTYNLDVMRRK